MAELAALRSEAGLCALAIGDRASAQRFADQARRGFSDKPDVNPCYKAALAELDQALWVQIGTALRSTRLRSSK